MAVLHHGRSLSFPSASNPSASQFNENLSRLRSSQPACSSLSSMKSRVNDLISLYNSIDDLLLLPHNQNIVSEKFEDQILDDYIRLLDGCSTVKDVISIAKQDLQELLSAVRRKNANGIHGYLTSRRKSKKTILKSLKTLRSSRKNSLEKESERTTLFYMLKEAESVAFNLLESLLSYTMGRERKSGMSFVLKLIYSKKVSHIMGDESLLNEFDKVDSFLQVSQENELVNHLKEMESSIQILEDEVEFLFRQLIKTRVSLLNILNH